jgi:hypothetical protein
MGRLLLYGMFQVLRMGACVAFDVIEIGADFNMFTVHGERFCNMKNKFHRK